MYVVIGANGYLGAYVIKNILQNTDEHILAVSRHPPEQQAERVRWTACDVTNPQDIEALNAEYLRNNCRNKVVYLAAYHHPDLVEKNPGVAWDTNVTAVSNFLNIMENVSCFFYPSTDSVYGESREGYHFREIDPLCPVNRYGRHKCAAEGLVTAFGCHVVRYPFLIASSLLKYKKHFYDTIVETLQRGQPIQMFCDSYRSALDFDTAAELLIRLMEKNPNDIPQILNVCGDEDLSKYDIGIRIADKLAVSRDLIRPISIADADGIFETKRAASTLMDNSALKRILGLSKIKIAL